MIPGHEGEDKGELSRLGQGHAGLGGDPQGISQEPGHGGHDQKLHSQKQENEDREGRGVLEKEAQVHEHADGDEEDAVQGVPEGEDVREHLQPVLRLGDHQAGDEGAQGQGEARHRAGKGGPQDHQDDGDEEDLPAACAHHEAQEGGDEKPGRQDDGPHGQHRDAQDLDKPEEAGALPVGQDRDQEHDGDDAQVLEDQNPERDLRLGRHQLAPLGVDPQDDGGAGEGDQESQEEGLGPAEMEGEAGQEGQQRRAEDLEGASQEHLPPHPGEAREGELDADGEEKEDDADLRQRLDLVAAADEPHAMGPEDDPRDQEPDDDGLAELLEKEDDRHGEGEDDAQIP